MAGYWLIVERYENWLVDRSENFRRFGLSERKVKPAERINPGDILITYVSRKACFADARRVRKPTMSRMRGGGPYQEPFSAALLTEPLVILDEDEWIPVSAVADQLSFLQTKRDWRQCFRNTLRVLAEADGNMILSRVKSAINAS
jgi:hypothetical protein